MLLHEGLPRYREGVAVRTVLSPILCQILTKLSASLEQTHIADFLRNFLEARASASIE